MGVNRVDTEILKYAVPHIPESGVVPKSSIILLNYLILQEYEKYDI